MIYFCSLEMAQTRSGSGFGDVAAVPNIAYNFLLTCFFKHDQNQLIIN
jgi:hypothetical protein